VSFLDYFSTDFLPDTDRTNLLARGAVYGGFQLRF
jgi:hypothetical protein